MTLSFRFGTVGSPLSTPKKPGGSVGSILRLKELGLNALELGWVRAVRVTEQTCAAIKSTAGEQDVLISIHAPYFINLNASDEEWINSRKRLMDAAIYGNLAGATDIIFHPGSYFEKPPSDVVPIAITRLEGCLQELRSAGNKVVLRPETMGKSAMLGSIEDTLAMAKALSGVEPCVDFAHLHARPGDGSINTYDEFAKILELYGKTLGEASLSRMHIHLSGIQYGDKGEKEHLPLKESDLNLKDLFRALSDFHCQGRILCESPIMEDDAIYMKEIWGEK
ncbi:MAG TPA: TIM barrel protein [Anaerolineales bacterium]|nr:TIM barrel protein [Anaerolineales bacterium]